MQDPRNPAGGGLLAPLNWQMRPSDSEASRPMPAAYDPFALAQQQQQMALQQASMPAGGNGGGGIGSSYSEITRGQPMDYDLLRMQMMGMQGAQQPGREDPNGNKPPPGGGGGGGDQAAQDVRLGQLGLNRPPVDAQLSWENWANKRGVNDGDLGSVMGYMGKVQQYQPYGQIPWDRFFRNAPTGGNRVR